MWGRLRWSFYRKIEHSASKRFEEEVTILRRSARPLVAAPAGVPSGTGPTNKRGRYSGWTWLNLLCLDAPLVAVAWHWLFAAEFNIAATLHASAALFLTAWLIYLTDRLGDSLWINPADAASLRQRFCVRHRAPWVAAVLVVGTAGLLVCLTLDHETLAAGAVVAAFALFYLLVNQLAPAVWRVLPLKEVAIGFLFAAGTVTPLYSGLTQEFLPAWLLFGGLCVLNCISIAVWERDLDAAQRRISIATAFPKTSRCFRAAALVLIAAGLALVISAPHLWRLYLCLAGSATLLRLVDLARNRLDQDTRTALADLVLLTPVVVLVADRLI